MKKTIRLLFLGIWLILFILISLTYADKGTFWPYPAALTEDSQKAIILHNQTEEVLILSTEYKADRDVEILEFIPFPSEPKVRLAIGNPFEEVQKLIKTKDIKFEGKPTKGGGAELIPVEIKLTKTIGLHDVTVIKINNINGFASWVRDFFNGRRIDIRNNLDKYCENADDYIKRGFNYFVFDAVNLTTEKTFIEPLIYRFASERLFYPLKTSNIVGGHGVIDVILILPGTICAEDWNWQECLDLQRSGWQSSSSSKLYPDELTPIYPEAKELFYKTKKIYLQVLTKSGPYNFQEDLLKDISNIAPYASKISTYASYGLDYEQEMTKDEEKDFVEAQCLKDESFREKTFYFSRYGFCCNDFIHPEEYRVYATLFKPDETGHLRLAGIPDGFVILEATTVKREVKSEKGLDKSIVDNFNEKNTKEYILENNLQGDRRITINNREAGKDNPSYPGKTYVSRVGFDKNKAKALVFVSHVASPEMGIGYFVLLQKKEGKWKLSDVVSRIIY